MHYSLAQTTPYSHRAAFLVCIVIRQGCNDMPGPSVGPLHNTVSALPRNIGAAKVQQEAVRPAQGSVQYNGVECQ